MDPTVVGDLSPATTLAMELAPIVGTILLTVITGIIGLVSRSLLSWVRANTTGKQQEVLFNFARQAVLAAEQLGINNDVGDKKTYAYDLIDDFLTARGITLSAAQIEAAIEAAVLAEVNQPTVEVRTDVADVTVTPANVTQPAVPEATVLEAPRER